MKKLNSDGMDIFPKIYIKCYTAKLRYDEIVGEVLTY